MSAEDRREQILRVAVDVVAEVGYHSASFARIIDHAGLSSTRLISYHFSSREALMRAALEYVVERATDYMRPKLDSADSARDRLAAYIRGNLEFIESEPACARTAVAILANLPASHEEAVAADVSTALLEQFFASAQGAGEMRRFDPGVMAVSLRAAIDAAVTRSVEGEADLRCYAEELVETFDRATALDTRR